MEHRPSTVHVRALKRAAAILGGKEALRASLHVPMTSLDEWLDGEVDPPLDIFLRAVDIISAPISSGATPAPAATRARLLARPPAALITPYAKVTRFLNDAFDGQERGTMLAAALEAAIDATQSQMGNIQLKDDKGLHIVSQHGFEAPFLEFFACVTDGHGAACGAAMKSHARVIVEDVATDPIFVGTEAAHVMEQASARAVQSTPLISLSGQFLGMLSTHFAHPHYPAAEELELVDRIAKRAACWLEDAKG